MAKGNIPYSTKKTIFNFANGNILIFSYDIIDKSMSKISEQTSTYYLLHYSLTTKAHKTGLSRKVKIEKLKMFAFAK